MTEPVTLGALGVALMALILAGGALWFSTRSVPDRVREQAREAHAAVEELRASWLRTRAGLDAMAEEVEGQLDRVEKRRRRAQAQETRAQAAQNAAPMDELGQARARARQLGLPGA